MFQGMGKENDELNRHWGFEPREVNKLILSHAHIDHSGLIPRLVHDGFEGKIICTHATKDLTTVLLEDSAEIQEDEVKYLNKRRAADGLPYLTPLYTSEDAKASFSMFETYDYENWNPIDEYVEVLFTDAGHIIGSACSSFKD